MTCEPRGRPWPVCRCERRHGPRVAHIAHILLDLKLYIKYLNLACGETEAMRQRETRCVRAREWRVVQYLEGGRITCSYIKQVIKQQYLLGALPASLFSAVRSECKCAHTPSIKSHTRVSLSKERRGTEAGRAHDAALRAPRCTHRATPRPPAWSCGCPVRAGLISEGLLPRPPKPAERPTTPPESLRSAGALTLPASARPPAPARRRSSRLRRSALLDGRPSPTPLNAPGPTELGRDCGVITSGVEAWAPGGRTRR